MGMKHPDGSWLYQQHTNPPDPGPQNFNPMVFASYTNHYAYMVSSRRVSGSQIGEKFSVPRDEPKKRFLVFDRSGNRTSLIYSSFGSPLQNPYPLNTKTFNPCGFPGELMLKTDTNSVTRNASDETEATSEMHEDTEDLDALLCSESEEETSTGHSPVETMGYKDGEGDEEVASSSTPTSKRRRLNVDCDPDPALADTASSVKTSCGSSGFANLDKKLRKERIQKTVSVLQSIIPGGKGMDALVIIDEAIRYLRSLRVKAKEALGAATM
eukprot:TRINITY_DN3013_c0_g2_i1.p1 TRINITY_DN3013_c0_g2~~TRINITY_DN3013_c0_g2_i1.p1  ORF type:complete len:269 (-),score=37.16 TRINITY_DN3013_c0_g2_i1:761-1567(-)